MSRICPCVSAVPEEATTFSTAHLVHTDHVHISFHQETAILFHDCLLGEIDAVKLVAFMINLAFGGVYVLRGLLVLFQYTSAECHDLSA